MCLSSITEKDFLSIQKNAVLYENNGQNKDSFSVFSPDNTSQQFITINKKTHCLFGIYRTYI